MLFGLFLLFQQKLMILIIEDYGELLAVLLLLLLLLEIRLRILVQ